MTQIKVLSAFEENSFYPLVAMLASSPAPDAFVESSPVVPYRSSRNSLISVQLSRSTCFL